MQNENLLNEELTTEQQTNNFLTKTCWKEAN